MLEIRKVTRPIDPRLCTPNCLPLVECLPTNVCDPAQHCIPDMICDPGIQPMYRRVSGTYKSAIPAGSGTIIELRVDIDGHRPQSKVSGDIYLRFSYMGHVFTLYYRSFVVEAPAVATSDDEHVITGQIKYYASPTTVNETLEVRVPRVSVFSPYPDATLKFYTSGVWQSTYVCSHQSTNFRATTLEIDCISGMPFPPTANTHVSPYPSGLPDENLTISAAYERAGIDMTVTEDDVLSDPDGPDLGTCWSYAELHDLMETRFDHFANALQWNVYFVVVPWFGQFATNTEGFLGIMFDWGGGQPGDTYLRQGASVAYNALVAYTGSVTTAYLDRYMLWCVAHELGHNFNLPHTFERSTYLDYASESFMNYPFYYTGGSGGGSNTDRYWANFRWEFDDVELAWMRHADRNDVMFGGRDWIGNNLLIYTQPQYEAANAPLELEIQAKDIFEYGEPVQLEIRLKNISAAPQLVAPTLAPEDHLIELYIRRPNGEEVRYIPPMKFLREPIPVQLAPGETISEAAVISYGARGLQFSDPGEYQIRAYYMVPNCAFAVSRALRIRVATPTSREDEELAHLMFHPEAAKFIYFNGSGRSPQITSRLEEAVERYAKTSPATVRHIHAALGFWLSEPAKKIKEKDGRRFITQREANLETAVSHLEAARGLIPARRGIRQAEAPFVDPAYRLITRILSESYEKLGRTEEAQKVCEESQRYLKRRELP